MEEEKVKAEPKSEEIHKLLEARTNKRLVLLGKFVGKLTQLLGRTLRYEQKGYKEPNSSERVPVIFCLWHNRILVAPAAARNWYSSKLAVLTSASHDGAFLAAAMSVFGFQAIRGSSSRRGKAALISMVKTLRAGTDICITPDGPRGPKYQIHGGVIKLAQLAQAPIIPIYIQIHDAWRLPGWDGLYIPKPFSRVTVICGSPIHIPRTLAESKFETQRKKLETNMKQGHLKDYT